MTTTEQILTACAHAFGVTRADIMGKSRLRSISQARQTACHLMRTRLSLSYQEIGIAMEYRHHTSAIHACGHVDGALKLATAARRETELTKRARVAEATVDAEGLRVAG